MRRSSMIIFTALLSVLLTALAAGPGFAQTTSFGDEVDVREVLLDVIVTDDEDHVVVGLDSDDFIVRQNGEPVDIQSATFYSNREFLGSAEQARELGIEQDAVPLNRYFILFFHHQRSLLPRLGANLLDAGRRAEQWVRGSLQPNDYVAVVSYFPTFSVLDFTNDRDVLAATIDEAVQGKAFSPKSLDRPANIPSLVDNLPQGDVDTIYEALSMTAHAADAVRGRKNLVLFSIGFGEVDSFGFYRADPRYYPETIQTLNDSNVAVYPVDLLATDVSPRSRISQLDNVLSRLASESGGEFFYNFVNYLTPLEQISEDNNGYYLLAFSPNGDQDTGSYHEIEIETTNSRFDVRTREGYVVGDSYPFADAPGGQPAR